MDAPKCRTCGERHWGPSCSPAPKSLASLTPRARRKALIAAALSSGQARQTTEAETITQPATAKARAPASSSHDRGAPAKSGPREAAKRGRPRIEDRDKPLNAQKT